MAEAHRPEFLDLVDLASARLGGRAVIANDEFFGEKENLLKPEKPVFIEGKFTDRGKWMDGWETRRRREPGHDWCAVRLGLPGIVRGVTISTAYFKGNQPESASLDSAEFAGDPGPGDLASAGAPWAVILPRTPLNPDAEHAIPMPDPRRATHLRLNIYPDGGVARLRVLGEVTPDWERLGPGEIDMAAIEHGGRVIAASDMHFGSRHNLIMPGRAANMGDGWETRRRRGPGHDWCIILLGRRALLRRVEVDTGHFKGNYPESCSLEASDVGAGGLDPGAASWSELVPRTKLAADQRRLFELDPRTRACTHVRFNIFPDGGVSRLRLFGAQA
jgi:allantoicase